SSACGRAWRYCSTSAPLLFYCYPHHPGLPSFPTRRSSDLGRAAPARLGSVHHAVVGRPNDLSRSHRDPTPAHPDAAGRRIAMRRSEEHTSELQSQSNLVCRLLLEKKKPTTRTDAHDHCSCL